MARLQTRRTVSRGTTPQSPARRVTQLLTSPRTRQQARSTSRDTTTITISHIDTRKPDQGLAAVQEQEDTVIVADNRLDDAWSGEGQLLESDSDNDRDDDSELEDESDIASEFERENQLKDLDRDLIIDSLPAIHQDSIKILSLFSPDSLPAILDEIRSVKTSTGRRFNQLKTRFDAGRRPCSTNGFLRVDLIVQKLAGSAQPMDGLWRPDAILYMANLVVLVSSVTTGDAQEVHDTLEFMYNNFPSSSLLGAINDGEGVAEEFGIDFVRATIDLSVSFRTQFFLHHARKLIRREAFDPDGFLATTFFDGVGSVRGYEKYEHHRIMMKKVQAACSTRIRKIRRFFSSDIEQPIDLDGLSKRYPWREFVSSVIHWVSQRNVELTDRISRQGGVEAIVEGLISIADSSSHLSEPWIQEQSQQYQTQSSADRAVSVPSPIKNDAVQIDETPVKRIRPKTSTSKSKSKSKQINRLREIKASRDAAEESDISDDISQPQSAKQDPPQLGGIARNPANGEKPRNLQLKSQGLPQASTGQIASANDDYEQPPHFDDEDDVQTEETRELALPRTDLSLKPTQETAVVLAAAKRQRITGNKENIGGKLRYTDPQPNALIESWDDHHEETPRRRRKHARDLATKDRDDDGEEDDFETDTREHKKPRTEQAALPRRPGLPTASSRASRETSESTPDLQDILRHRNSQPPQSAQPMRSRSPLIQGARGPADRTQPPSSSTPAPSRTRDPSPARPEPPATQVQHANDAAKVNARRFFNASQRMPQVRRRWEESEIDRLMESVACYGTAWARILEEDKTHPDGPMLGSRDQVALKDKARNIKMDFLKACQRLPEGFAAVSIKASDKQKLDELSVPYPSEDEPRGRGVDGGN